MFLEAQFGEDAVSPVALPKLAKEQEEAKAKADDGIKAVKEEQDADEEQQLKARQQAELERLHKLGIPVPGVLISIDGGKMQATVWLEDLEVECTNRVFADRVRAVVERAVEVIAPLWG